MTDFQNTLLWVAAICAAFNVGVTLTCTILDYMRAKALRKMRKVMLEQLAGLTQSDLSTYDIHIFPADETDPGSDPGSKLN